jgi:hypothetical protein
LKKAAECIILKLSSIVFAMLNNETGSFHDREALLLSVQEVDRSWKDDCLEALVHTNVLAHWACWLKVRFQWHFLMVHPAECDDRGN